MSGIYLLMINTLTRLTRMHCI